MYIFIYFLNYFSSFSSIAVCRYDGCDGELHHLVHRLQTIKIRMELEKERHHVEILNLDLNVITSETFVDCL